MLRGWLFSLGCIAVSFTSTGFADDPRWIEFPGGSGPGAGKHVVLISGDEEYRSEEALPQMGKILSKHHGFRCTVLFAINPETGEINPKESANIPGLESLAKADLMIIATRFRNLADDQMQHIADYLDSGRPVIGLRTATHAFNIPKGRKFYNQSWNCDLPNSKQGFGKQVLGETWVAHHGHHGKEATRGIIAPGQEQHPVLRGVASGAIFGPSDVYTVTLPLPGDSLPLVLGEVVAGMAPTDPKLEGKKNDPMMPIAWTKTYSANGKAGRVFTTTMGAATDLSSEALRRLLVNATYWAVGLESSIPSSANVNIVGKYEPTKFGFDGFVKGKKPADYAAME